jgi:hypothetical protein
MNFQTLVRRIAYEPSKQENCSPYPENVASHTAPPFPHLTSLFSSIFFEVGTIFKYKAPVNDIYDFYFISQNTFKVQLTYKNHVKGQLKKCN